MVPSGAFRCPQVPWWGLASLTLGWWSYCSTETVFISMNSSQFRHLRVEVDSTSTTSSSLVSLPMFSAKCSILRCTFFLHRPTSCNCFEHSSLMNYEWRLNQRCPCNFYCRLVELKPRGEEFSWRLRIKNLQNRKETKRKSSQKVAPVKLQNY